MAKIYPKFETNFNNSHGEKRVFEAFEKLPDDWYVFHSVKWSEKRRSGNVSWGEADFLVFNKRYGMLVIEVKSGLITCRDGVFRQKRLDNGQEFNITPFEQADRSKYAILGELRKRKLGDCCFIDKAVWFPSIEDDFSSVDLPMAYKKELILNSFDLDDPLESLERIFRYYNADSFTALSDYDIDTIIQLLVPCFDLTPVCGFAKDEVDFSFNQLTNEQKRILDFVNDEDDVAVCGTAGTGKTFVALERARRFGVDDKNVLFLCYNRKLREFLFDFYKYRNVDYYTITQILYNISPESTVPVVHWGALNKFSFKDKCDYQYLIIDEAQDFDNEALKILIDKAKQEGVGVTLFYDKNQSVLHTNIPEIIESFDCKLTLKNNCRNTIKILETANNSVNLPPNPCHLSTPGEIPVFHYSSSQDRVLEKIGQIIQNYKKEGFAASDIVILTMSTEEFSILSGKDYIGENHIVNGRSITSIHFTTARKFKGLESDCVIIVDFNINRLDDEDYKKLFYVASSRAKQKLDVFTVADKSQMEEASNKLGGPFGPIIKLSNKLKMKVEEA